jgi:LPS O-antigen subunit length determinant protein (WzzB/FepE family)
MSTMKKNNLDSNDFEHPEDEIDIKDLLKAFWDKKIIIITLTSLFSIAAVLISLKLPNIYTSTTLLSPVGQQTSTSNSNGGIGGLANLAGFSLSAQSIGNSTKALTKVKTLSFYKENILPNIFLPDLVAIESWDSQNNIITYASNKFYDAESKTILKTASPQTTYKKFMKSVTFSKDVNGFIAISVKHQSPYIAKEWTELIVDQLNQFYRTQDKRKAEASMNFLNAQIAQTNYTEIKNIIAELLKQEIQQLTLIEANDFYVFSYLDPPIAKEEKSEPTRSSISILGAVLGFMLGLFSVLVTNYFSTKK